MSHSFAVLSLSALAGVVLAACGARGPLDVEVIDVVTSPDAAGGGNTTTSTTDGGGGSSTTSDDAGGTTTGPGSGSGGLTGIPGLSEDGGIVGCGTCVAGQCSSSITACLADTSCSSSLTCILTTCLTGGTGGTGGLSCITGCAGTSGITSLLPILECIAGTCGSQCSSVIGNVGGL